MSKPLDVKRGIAASTVGAPEANGELGDEGRPEALRGNDPRAPRRQKKTNQVRRKKAEQTEELRAIKASVRLSTFERLRAYSFRNNVNISVAVDDVLDRALPYYQLVENAKPPVDQKTAAVPLSLTGTD